MAFFNTKAKRWRFQAAALCWRRKGSIMALLALFIFIVLPVIEIYLFIEIGAAIGAGWTIALIFVTAALGLSAMRRQGLAVLEEAQAAQIAGRPPLGAVAHGVLILLGGGLLLVPGFFTDALGLLFLWQLSRTFFIGAVLQALLTRIISIRPNESRSGPPRRKRTDDGKTIEGDFRIDGE